MNYYQPNGTFIGPRVWSQRQYRRFLTHGVVGSDSNRPDINFIKHGMTANNVIAHYEKQDQFAKEMGELSPTDAPNCY